jgi:hypothetical protein
MVVPFKASYSRQRTPSLETSLREVWDCDTDLFLWENIPKKILFVKNSIFWMAKNACIFKAKQENEKGLFCTAKILFNKAAFATSKPLEGKRNKKTLSGAF